MNLPNKLTILRICMVPTFMIALAIPETLNPADPTSAVCALIAALLFIAASLTDMLDGKIARKYHLVTNFGKFLDPLADKFMVIGAMLMILYKYDAIRHLWVWATVLVVFRELAVTSLRLIASGSGGVVIAANMLGKIKTVTQIVCVSCVLLEPLVYHYLLSAISSSAAQTMEGILPLTWISMAAMCVFTLWSGINYLVGGRQYLTMKQS